jgi:phosphoribosylpyrophosphate synthetase
MKKHSNLNLVYATPSEVLVYVLKEYKKKRTFYPEDHIKSIKLSNFNIECIQNLASGHTTCFDEYEQKKNQIADWLKEEIPDSFHPRFVVAPPSRRTVARGLAESLAKKYQCTDLSGFFSKRNPELKAGEREVAVETLKENLICTTGLECIQEGDSILIVDDVLSTGISIDSMKAKIICLSDAVDLRFVGAAALKV